METKDLFALTEEQWRLVDRLNEVLSGTANLQEALKIGLDVLLIALNQSGGALFLPRFCEHIAQDWTFVSPPAVWDEHLAGEHSPLHDMINQAIKTGQIVPGSEVLNTGAVFPLVTSTAAPRNLGVLLVSGPAIPPAAYPLWQALLRPFIRVVSLHSAMSGSKPNAPSYLELMRSRNTLRAMFDNLPISIYITDNAFNIVAINLSRANRVEQSPKQLVGRKCYEKLYNRSSVCPACRVSEGFDTGESTMRVNRVWQDSEKFIEWEVSTFPIFDEKNHVHQTIVVEQDVTEKRNLESNLIQSEKLAAVGQLAAGVAHEINNPLTAIIANAQILRREVSPETPDNADLLDSIKLIEMAGTRASQVVRNLLGIARKEKYEFEPVDLNETLHNALSLAQHELIGRPIQIELDLAEDLPEMVASQDQLQGVWINLILNAIDAIDKDPGKISITSRCTADDILVTIIDNGKGISPDHLPRLFEPFFTTKTPGRGTGLGLSVCMRAVKHHGGTIKVESKQGEWTRFTVVLPAPHA